MADDGQFYDEEPVFTSSTKYHRESCHMINQVRRRNYRRLSSWKSAVAIGLEPCGLCNPFYIRPVGAQPAITPTPVTSPIRVIPQAGQAPSAAATQNQLPAADVSAWRRRIEQALSRLDQTGQRPSNESLAARLSRLSRENVLPRSIAAMMRAIAEMRNEVEHESKTLSTAEDLAAWANWNAILLWAKDEGLQI